VQDAEQPGRWLHIKLQVVEGEETFWTTLLMRDDNLYVLGFMNQQGVVYELVDNKSSVTMLPGRYKAKHQVWSTKYRTMLGTNISNAKAAHELAGAHLGHSFAMKAVRVLSRHPNYVEGDMNPRVALAGLILMVCESTRMNPLQDGIAGGWRNGTGFTEQLMNDYVWKYGDKSKVLLKWKRKKYDKPESLPQHPIKELQDIHLVLNNPPATQAGKQEKNNQQHNKALKKQTHEDLQDSNDSQKNQPNSSNSDNNQNNGESSDGSNNCGQQNQGDRSHSDGSNSDDSKDASQPRKADESQGYDQGHGRPRVELLAMRADLRVGTKIIVFDGKRGQIIYIHREQGEQGRMVDLVLTGPYTGISAYGSFAIKIDIPDTPPIKWQWDGYDLEYAAQVDELPVTQKIHNVAEVTYAVMSNALEATMQVMLRLKDQHSPSGVHGEITALIDGFEVSSILFKCTEGTGQCFSPDTASDSDSWFLLQLARNVVAVPCAKVLHINVKLEIKTSNNQEVKYLKADLKFANGIPS